VPDEGPNSQPQESFPVIERPEHLTEAGARFFDAHEKVATFLLFVANLVVRADEVRKIAAEALLKGDPEPEKREELERKLEEGDVVSDTLRKEYRQLLFETTLARAVDNFLTYVAELMSVVFKTRPETLRSGAKVEIAYILSHDSMDDLIENLAERRVEQLAYAGLRELQENLETTLGFQLFTSEEELEQAVMLVEGRNIVVHNRGVVNKTYLSRVPGFDGKLGERLQFNVDPFFDDLAFLAKAGVDIDARAAAKWDIRRSASRDSGGNGVICSL